MYMACVSSLNRRPVALPARHAALAQFALRTGEPPCSSGGSAGGIRDVTRVNSDSGFTGTGAEKQAVRAATVGRGSCKLVGERQPGLDITAGQ